MKIKKKACLECESTGYLCEDDNTCAPKGECPKCNGKGYIEIYPDKRGIFPFSEEICICPSCGNGKNENDFYYKKPKKYSRENYPQSQIGEEDSKPIIDDYLDVCCGKCGYRWYEYVYDPENV